MALSLRIPAAALLCALAHKACGSATPEQLDPLEGQLRLVKGNGEPDIGDDRVAGRLLVYHSGRWGSICSDDPNHDRRLGDSYTNGDFTIFEAGVACETMGLGKAFSYYYGDGYDGTFGIRRLGGDGGDGGDDDDFEFVPAEGESGVVWLSGVSCESEWFLSRDYGDLTSCRHDGWGNNECSHKNDVHISCDLPGVPDLKDGKFVLDIGFSDTDTKCVDILRPDERDLFRDAEEYFNRRRYVSSTSTETTTITTTVTVSTTSAVPTTASLCESVYAGDGGADFEITHENGQACARRTDGVGVWYVYLRLLCRTWDLSSPLVSYVDKGSCGPRGDNAQADLSTCPNGARLVAHQSSNSDAVPVAVIDDCLFFELSVYECIPPPERPPEPQCTDFVPEGEAKWYDGEGSMFDCAWYGSGSGRRCDSSGSSNFGRAARQACCRCGGGSAELSGTFSFISEGTQQQVETAASRALLQLYGLSSPSELSVQVSEGESRTSSTATTTSPHTTTETTVSTTTETTTTATTTTQTTTTATTITQTTTTVTTVTTAGGGRRLSSVDAAPAARSATEEKSSLDRRLSSVVHETDVQQSSPRAMRTLWGPEEARTQAGGRQLSSVVLEMDTEQPAAGRITESLRATEEARTEAGGRQLSGAGARWWQVGYVVRGSLAATQSHISSVSGNVTSAFFSLLNASLAQDGLELADWSLEGSEPALPTETSTTVTTSVTATTTTAPPVTPTAAPAGASAPAGSEKKTDGASVVAVGIGTFAGTLGLVCLVVAVVVVWKGGLAKPASPENQNLQPAMDSEHAGIQRGASRGLQSETIGV